MSEPAALLAAVRTAAGTKGWDAGVRLARDGAVLGVHDDGTEVLLRVKAAQRALPYEVYLWPGEPDWGCDCGVKEGACAHVAAAAIALERTRAGGVALPEPSATYRVTLVYRFTTTEGGLSASRAVRHADGREEPFEGILAKASLLASPADVAAESMLVSAPPGPLAADSLRRLLALLDGCEDATVDGRSVSIVGEPALFRVRVMDDGDGFRVVLARPAGVDALWRGAARQGDVLRPTSHGELTPEQRKMLAQGVRYAAGEVVALVAQALPGLRRRVPIDIATTRLPTADALVPRVSVKLTERAFGLEVLPEVVYGDPPIARVLSSGGLEVLSERVVPARDPAAERAVQRSWEDRFKRPVGHRTTVTPTEAAAFLARLSVDHHGPVGGAVDPVRYQVADAPLQPSIDVGEPTAEGYGFHVDFTVPGGGHADPRAVLDAWRSGRPLVPLLEGGFAPLPAGWLARHGAVLRELLDMRDAQERVPRQAVAALVELLGDGQVAAPPDLARLHGWLAEGKGLPETPVPEALVTPLRPYQEVGFRWLGFLGDMGFHGILADDMGLGKTLQALATLMARPGPHLVVAPTSVLRSWESELKRSAPTVRANFFHGTGRALDPTASITLTSYALLRLDAAALGEVAWSTVVLDEAQAIKNATSQTARAAFRIRAERRFVLTGTPVENRLEELWSLFRFLMPGLLGPLDAFRERYVSPIEAGDPGARAALRARVRPYILRRLKQDVARELPPLTSMIERCEMGPEQRRFYDTVRLAARQEVQEALRKGAGSTMHVLEALLRLRQACCDPELVPGGGGRSLGAAKLDRLEQILVDLAVEGHRALVFSQWTGLLDRVEPRLRALGIDWVRLDGSTRDRGAAIDRFQASDGPPVFLLSLKAGGTGLNLTAADYVIHLDPWWNPAVEQQATDRAHRIGQDRPVVSIRLVTAGTVEERILELQDAKRGLLEAAMGAEGGLVQSLGAEELRALFDAA